MSVGELFAIGMCVLSGGGVHSRLYLCIDWLVSSLWQVKVVTAFDVGCSRAFLTVMLR